MTSLPVTSFYAAFFGLLLFALSVQVIRAPSTERSAMRPWSQSRPTMTEQTDWAGWRV